VELKKNPTQQFSEYFKNYSKILTKVISLAKRSTYGRQITTSKNEARATWNIINTELCKKNKIESTQALTVNGTINTDPHFLVKIFNEHYSEVADNIYTKINENDVANSMKHYDHMTFMSKALGVHSLNW
jgi:phenylalanyl-tRNA synthetase alpha subunit